MLRSARNLPQSRREAQVSQTKDFINPLAGEGTNPSAQHEAGEKSKQRHLERESVRDCLEICGAGSKIS